MGAVLNGGLGAGVGPRRPSARAGVSSTTPASLEPRRGRPVLPAAPARRADAVPRPGECAGPGPGLAPGHGRPQALAGSPRRASRSPSADALPPRREEGRPRRLLPPPGGRGNDPSRLATDARRHPRATASPQSTSPAARAAVPPCWEPAPSGLSPTEPPASCYRLSPNRSPFVAESGCPDSAAALRRTTSRGSGKKVRALSGPPAGRTTPATHSRGRSPRDRSAPAPPTPSPTVAAPPSPTSGGHPRPSAQPPHSPPAAPIPTEPR